MDGLYLSINKAAARTFNCIAGFPPLPYASPLANLFATDHSPQIGCVSTDWILQEESALLPPQYEGLNIMDADRLCTGWWEPPSDTPLHPYCLLISQVNCCCIDWLAALLIQVVVVVWSLFSLIIEGSMFRVVWPSPKSYITERRTWMYCKNWIPDWRCFLQWLLELLQHRNHMGPKSILLIDHKTKTKAFRIKIKFGQQNHSLGHCAWWNA